MAKIIDLEDNLLWSSKPEIAKFKKDFTLTLKDFLADQNSSFLSFCPDKFDEEELIIKVENGLVTTGNFVGYFNFAGQGINIKSRFGEVFLQRMLNFANDVFIDDYQSPAKIQKNNQDFAKFILFYLFVSKLEKAMILGIPRSYQSKNYHQSTLIGKLNTKEFIRRDLPFSGKISSTNREQSEVACIVNVIYTALKIVQKSGFNVLNLTRILNTLSPLRSNFNPLDIDKAINHKALLNPIFASFKQALEYAKLIILNNGLIQNKDSSQNAPSFIVNTASLFELYITKLLGLYFPDWGVGNQKIELYKNNFYSRRIIPDIVMTRGNDVLIFDTKYKRMNLTPKGANSLGDVCREDFFQIHTYMSYYQNEESNLIAGGLLYPLNKFNKALCYSESFFDNKNVKFIIDGVVISQTLKELLANESEFIQRIRSLIDR